MSSDRHVVFVLEVSKHLYIVMCSCYCDESKCC